MKYSWLAARRRYFAHRGVQEPLRASLRSALPRAATRWQEVEFVALDVETTSPDPATAEMLSIGWVVVRHGRVELDSAESWLVKPGGEVGDSASVHGLTDTLVGTGREWGPVLDKVVEVLAGRVLLLHHAGLDKGLLDRMCQRRYGTKLAVPVVDTMVLALRLQRNRHHLGEEASLRLPDLRDAYGLPRYVAHDCLVDAIATAELLLAMAAHRRIENLGELLA